MQLLPEEETLSAGEVLQEGRSLAPGELRDLCADLLEDPRPEDVALLIAYDVQRLGPSETHLRILFSLLEGRPEETKRSLGWLLRELEHEIHETERIGAVGDLQGSLEFLGEILGEDMEEFVARRAGVQPQTVRRWAGGYSTDRTVQYEIRALAGLLYSLGRARCWQNDQLETWLGTPSRTGNTPLELWLRDGRIGPGGVSEEDEEYLRRWGYVF